MPVGYSINTFKKERICAAFGWKLSRIHFHSITKPLSSITPYHALSSMHQEYGGIKHFALWEHTVCIKTLLPAEMIPGLLNW